MTTSRPAEKVSPRGLHLPPAVMDALCTQARAGVPREVCGLLLGTRRGPVVEVAEALPTKNDFEIYKSSFPGDARVRTTERAYAIAPLAILGAHREARARGLAVVGAYHSHVDADAQLSPLDRSMATDATGRPLWPGAVHVVLSVSALSASAADFLRAFAHDDARGDFVELEVEVPRPAR